MDSGVLLEQDFERLASLIVDEKQNNARYLVYDVLRF